jgi:uncharacterized membrane protein
VPLASPEPFIDVFWINTSATHHFLSGQNPYSQNYPDIYQGYYGYKPGFTYWPFYLNAAAIFTALHCDIRYLGVLSDLMFAGVLVWVCKKGFVRALTTWGFVLIWLALPVSLFIIEQAWVDSLMLLTAVIAVIAYGSGWITISALFAGASIATKQYGFIVPAMITFAILGSQGWKKSVFFLSRILITVSILVFPFLIWDFESFYRNTIQILITIPMRTDSLTIPAFFSNIHNFEPPGQFLLILYVAAFSFGLHSCFRDPRPSAVLFTSAFCYGFIFLMGKQASANYYVVVVGLALMGLAQRTGEQNLACRT